jgi:hypothetical protein
MAELWGVVEGLRYAYRLGFRKLQLSVDLSVVEWHVEERDG